MMKRILASLTVMSTSAIASGAYAAPLVPESSGGQTIVAASADPVSIVFQGESGWLTKDLYLSTSEGDRFLFDGATAEIGDRIELGSFAPGTELVFKLKPEGMAYDLYSGSGERNPFGFANARAMTLPATGMAGMVTHVSFEDLKGGGDEDFDDFSFLVENAFADAIATPTPGAFALMGTAVAGFAASRRKGKRRGD